MVVLKFRLKVSDCGNKLTFDIDWSISLSRLSVSSRITNDRRKIFHGGWHRAAADPPVLCFFIHYSENFHPLWLSLILFKGFKPNLTFQPFWPFFSLFSDKLFGKRLLQARHYIMSRKSWLKMMPTENCDIMMTFPGMEESALSCLLRGVCPHVRMSDLIHLCSELMPQTFDRICPQISYSTP